LNRRNDLGSGHASAAARNLRSKQAHDLTRWQVRVQQPRNPKKPRMHPLSSLRRRGQQVSKK
jgi:hypothetical protein